MAGRRGTSGIGSVDVDWQGHVQYDTSTYDMANTEKTGTGTVPNRGPVTGYGAKKASKTKKNSF